MAGGISQIQADNATTTSTPETAPPTFKLTDGGYLTLWCIFSVVVADTKIGPIVFGLSSIALIYQLTLLVQGK